MYIISNKVVLLWQVRTHDLVYVKMPGRIQLDLYNHFRREEKLGIL